MRFELHIDTDNAAFERTPHLEVARILATLAAQFEAFEGAEYRTHSLRDINGNKVGEWAWKKEEP